jgi:hypothetical protein
MTDYMSKGKRGNSSKNKVLDFKVGEIFYVLWPRRTQGNTYRFRGLQVERGHSAH